MYKNSNVENVTNLYVQSAHDSDRSFHVFKKFLRHLSSYLREKKVFVQIKSELFDPLNVCNGVHQVYILGMFHLLLFERDSLKTFPSCENFGFADDFKIFALNRSQRTNCAKSNRCSKYQNSIENQQMQAPKY